MTPEDDLPKPPRRGRRPTAAYGRLPLRERAADDLMTAIGTGFRGPDGRPGYLLRQAQQAMRAAIEQEVREVGITAPQYSILSALRHEPGVNATELADLSMLRQQTVNEIVRALERNGLVERTVDEHDRRALRLRLTASGRATLQKADRRVDRLERRTLKDVPERDWKIVANWLVTCAQVGADERTTPHRRRTA